MCPCKYPLDTDRNGIIRRQKDTDFITNETSSKVLPPSISPSIKDANSFEKTNNIKKAITDIISIKFLPTWFSLSLASYFSNALYSVMILLMATGIPAVDIFKNKL